MHDTSERLAMYFDTRESYGTVYFEVTVVRVEDDTDAIMPNGMPAPTMRNLSSPHPLDNLTIQTYDYGYQGNREMIPASIKYANVGDVDLRTGESMVKTLKKVYAALDKDYNRDGNAAHMGQTAMRVARALGIKEAIVRTDAGWRSSFSEMQFRTINLAAFSDRIAASINTYLATGVAKAA